MHLKGYIVNPDYVLLKTHCLKKYISRSSFISGDKINKTAHNTISFCMKKYLVNRH